MDQKSVERAAKYLARRMRPFRSWILRAGQTLPLYVTEFQFRYNNRENLTSSARRLRAASGFIAALLLTTNPKMEANRTREKIPTGLGGYDVRCPD